AHPVLPPNPRLAKSNTYQLAFPACSAGTVQLGPEIVGERCQADLCVDAIEPPGMRKAPLFIHCLIVPNDCSTVFMAAVHDLGTSDEPFHHGLEYGFTLPAINGSPYA
ncbi:hypothetical protein, partial [Sphingobium sp.]|uniref:hypothetical protein n=1 Tax=Sphingobium sp. TaxID=1912891 RepID=UPI0026011FDF